MANEQVYNRVENLGLKCWEVYQNGNQLRMRCGFGGGKKEDGTYKKEVSITVWVNLDECEIAEDDYNGALINVDGQLSAKEWTNKDNITTAQLNLNATRVVKRVFKN